MSADSMVSEALATVPKAVAAGIVDMGTGMLLAVKTTDSHPQDVLDMLAAATKDLFEGDTVMSIEDTFKKIRSDSTPSHYFKEIIVNSENLIHIFARVKSDPSIILAVVTRIDANLGMVMTKARHVSNNGTV
jgi:hypothetical protein